MKTQTLQESVKMQTQEIVKKCNHLEIVKIENLAENKNTKIIHKQECAEIICNQDIADNILLLGMSYTKFASYSNYSLTKIIQNVKD